MFRNILIVGIGGFIGSVARYLAVVYLTEKASVRFPIGTFAVNILGCLLIGILAGLSERYAILPEWRLFFATGVCAGFTTFSSFAFENVRLLQDKDYLTFVLYTVASFAVGIAATIAGMVLTRP